MRIKDLTLKKIGVFEQMYINFRKEENQQNAEIHLFTGPNGSGKSTILQALAAGFNGTFSEDGRCLSIANHLSKKLHSFENVRNQYVSRAEIKLQNNEVITSRWCPNCNKLHIDSRNSLVNEYRAQINLVTLPAYEFQFAVFCYSGYRAISYQNNNNITNEEVNPLQNSLEFIKPTDSNFTIRNLLITALLKRSYALQENDQETTQHYNRLIAGVEDNKGIVPGKQTQHCKWVIGWNDEQGDPITSNIHWTKKLGKPLTFMYQDWITESDFDSEEDIQKYKDIIDALEIPF